MEWTLGQRPAENERHVVRLLRNRIHLQPHPAACVVVSLVETQAEFKVATTARLASRAIARRSVLLEAVTLVADAHPTQALAEAILVQERAVEQLAGRQADDEKVAVELQGEDRAPVEAVADEVAKNRFVI